jgi:energy-coupling factor transport system ATP-binding protein
MRYIMLRIQDLTYAYPQHESGIGPYSLSVRPGEVLHVTGSSGCGKSTLARCAAGLIPHLYHGSMGGEVLVGGRPTGATPLWELAENAGFVFQNPAAQMLGVSVEEEILLGLENLGLDCCEMHDRLEESLAAFGLGELRARRPQTLSGGEQQKLALAAITARRPPLLVLDEPLSMLDVTAATDLAGRLSALARSGVAIILFEHRADYLADMPGLRVMAMDYPAGPAAPDCAATRARPAIPAGGPPRLTVSGLGVSIGGKRILRNLSFSVEPGTITAIVGRNGCGKTTLLRALAGLQAHDGTVAAGGIRPDFGHVFQNADLQLFNPTVRREILYRVKNPDMELYAWLTEVLGLARYENTPPLILSEGEKKRVALATVLMRDPAGGILLDEPSLGQDTAHKTMLIEVCRGLAARGKIVIMTTHELHLAAMADRVALLAADGAAIAADGAPERVFRDSPAWKRAGMFVPAWITCSEPDGIPA